MNTASNNQPRRTALPLGVAPLGLRRAEAAAYIGVSPSEFDTLVADGRMPVPRMVNSLSIWDRREIDAAFNRL